MPVTPLAAGGAVLAAADISKSLGPGFPLRVTRAWAVVDGKLALRFTLTNPGSKAIEIGGLGLPMIFDNILTGRSLEAAHEHASFDDPYVGEDAGYLQVTRLNGAGPALLVVPEKGTPFELYKPILDQRDASGKVKIYNDPEPRGTTFEGFYDWMVASKGFAETQWKGVRQWNRTTSLILKPGESRRIGLRFLLSSTIRKIDSTLIANGRPVALGVPGYIVPTDMPAQLFLHAARPVASIAVFPKGALAVGAAKSLENGWIKYAVTGKILGRARLTLTYAGGSVQTVQYLVTKPEAQVVADLGHFLTTRQWYVNPRDPFHRSPSIMSYDRSAGHIVTEDGRVWIAGLSDEGGAGSWLAAIMKQLNNPDPGEVAKFETFANKVLWGRLQLSTGPHKYGVRKSLFYYDPAHMPAGTYAPDIDWSTWASWNRKQAASIGRSFNYPHVAAAWWVLYRLARYHQNLVTQEDWRTYLIRAGETIKAMMRDAPAYTRFGQMEGDVFVAILGDLRREGLTREASRIETLMKGRAERWRREKYPFGSEMPWDSTGQEEVYAWMRYFGYARQARKTRDVILGYDPTLPNWAYNGSARRYWDFLYAGKTQRIERQLHHYGSSINAIPLFNSFRRNPKDFYLLRVAYGGLMGSLSNIDAKGFGAAAFHSFPDMMKFDSYSGDYGMSFFGHAFSSASYMVHHPIFGWLGFGGQVTQTGGVVTLTPKDSARDRVFIAPAGLWLTLRAGKFRHVRYDPATRKVQLVLARKDRHTSRAYLQFKVTVKRAGQYRMTSSTAVERGMHVVTLHHSPVTVELSPVPER